MMVAPGNAQHMGARANQQDAFAFSDKDDLPFVRHGGVLAIVADGMGGLAKGNEASRLAVNAFLKSYMSKAPDEPIVDALRRALSDGNNAVYQFANNMGEAENVGTTMVAAVVHAQNLYWISVGDSRLYLCRRGQLTQVTTDHHYAYELDRDAEAGKITRDEALHHPERGALTSFLGQSAPEQIDRNYRPFPLDDGDKLLLCSDGLYAALSEEEILQSLASEPQDAAEALIHRVLQKNRPEQDNLTAAILDCQADLPETRRRVPQKTASRTKHKWLLYSVAIVLGVMGVGAGAWWFKNNTTSDKPGVAQPRSPVTTPQWHRAMHDKPEQDRVPMAETVPMDTPASTPPRAAAIAPERAEPEPVLLIPSPQNKIETPKMNSPLAKQAHRSTAQPGAQPDAQSGGAVDSPAGKEKNP